VGPALCAPPLDSIASEARSKLVEAEQDKKRFKNEKKKEAQGGGEEEEGRWQGVGGRR